MSLRVKVALQIMIMLMGALLISATAVWSIKGIEQDYDFALTGYDELREVYGSVGSHMMMAQESLAASPGDRDRALYHLQNALDRFELYRAGVKQIPRASPHDEAAEQAIQAALTRALEAARSGDADDREEAEEIRTAMVQTGMFASRMGNVIKSKSEAAAQKRRDNLITITMLGAVVVLGAVALGIVQYQGVVTPIQKLTDGVRKLSAGEFQQRLKVEEPGVRGARGGVQSDGRGAE